MADIIWKGKHPGFFSAPGCFNAGRLPYYKPQIGIIIMEDAGERLKRVRDRLNLTIRDVEEASRKIATRHKNDEFVVGLSRLSEIENKGTVLTIYRLYSLCSIYRLDLLEVMEWYAVDLGELATDSAVVAITRT